MELGARLECALSFVRRGSKIYDIGSDHGYLPAELISRGICEKAVVCDVNKGPLERGKLTFAEKGLTGRAEFYLTDGLSGLFFDEFPADVAICGMGGELIASILDARRDVWELDVHFILQPMTKAEVLRRYLWENGFQILSEKAVCEGDKTYVVMSAVHGDLAVGYSETELLIGKRESVVSCPETAVLYGKIISSIQKKKDGMASAGQDVTELNKLICELKNEAMLREDM